jgi:hypothetical protein
MDEKHNHRLEIIKDRRQRKDVKSYMHSISSFLHTQKQSLLTGFLLIVAAMLLLGIFSQFQPPRTSLPPDGVTVLDYRTFIEQVKARNVLAVVIQGDEIHGLLANSLSGSHSPTSGALMEHEQLDRSQFETLLQPERGSSEDSSCLPTSASK